MRKSRKKLGLALGSGAQRGFALLGVLKALEEADIEIDMVSGASIGSMVAACYALSKDATATAEYLMSEAQIVKMPGWLDLRITRGLVQEKTLSAMMHQVFKDQYFSETKIPLCIVSTDLTNGGSYNFQRGKITPAVQASCSVPLLFEPLHVGNHYFVDGGLSDPVPVKPLKKMGADVVIAVNLYHRHEFLSSQFNLIKTALRTSRIALYNLAQNSIKEADLVIAPDMSPFVKNVSLKMAVTEKMMKDMVAVGYDLTKKQIPKIKKLLQD